MAESVQIERPSGLVIPEARSFTASFLDTPEVRSEEDGSFSFIGYAATFERKSVDLGGFTEVIKRGAFRSVLDDHGADVRFLYNHNADYLLARTSSGTLELREDPRGLRVFAKVAPTSYANDLRVLVQRGDLSQMSFGFTVASGGDTWVKEDNEVIRYVRQVGSLLDVSMVVYPAYPTSTISSMRSLDVLGVPVYTDGGEVRADELIDLASRIHSGEVEADAEHRSIIDAALSKTEAISPWMAERATRSEDPLAEPEEPLEEIRGSDIELAKARLSLNAHSL